MLWQYYYDDYHPTVLRLLLKLDDNVKGDVDVNLIQCNPQDK